MVLPVLNLDVPINEVIKEDSVNASYVGNYGNSVVYVLNYSFNPKLANRLLATKLILSITTQQGNTSVSPQIVKGFNPEQIRNNLLQQVNIYKAAAKRKNQYPFSVVRNLTKYFDPKTIDNQVLKSTVYINRSASEYNSISYNPNSNNQNLNSNNNLSTYTSTNPFNLRQLRVSLKQTQYLDPASLYINPTNTIVPTSTSIKGLIPKPNALQNQRLLQNPKAKNLLTSFLSKTTSNNTNTLPSNAIITEVKKITTDLLSVGDRLIFPLNLIGQKDFKLIFELYDLNDNKVQQFDVAVAHNTNVNNVFITKPPQITQNTVTGINTVAISVNQIDRAAHGVSVYRKVIYAQRNVSDAGYVKVTDIPLKAGDAAYTFRDRLLSTSDVIYRFIPYDKNKDLASVFNTCYIKNNSINKSGTNVPLPKQISTRQNFCVFDYSIDNDCIIVKATSLPAGAVAVTFYRRNKTIYEENYKRLGNIIRLQPNSSIPLRLIDTRVKLYNVYEYKVGIIYLDGIEELNSNVLSVEFRPIEKNLAVSNIINITNTTYGDGKPDITFDITYSYDRNQYENIKNLLTGQNLLAEYGDQITENRQLLGKLFAYRVLRTNMSTGEMEDFGIITETSFSDRKQGLAKGVKPLQIGAEYSYKVTTYLRDPQTLFKTLTQRVVPGENIDQSQQNSNESYTLYPYKWRQPVTFRAGTLYTDTSIIRSYPIPLSSFEFGNIVDIKEVTVKVVNDLPTISDAKAVFLKTQSISITWNIVGNINKIDHFMIIRDMIGMKTIVGAAHAIGDNNIRFIDKLENNEKGSATYIIIPIYYDDTEGTQVITNTIAIT